MDTPRTDGAKLTIACQDSFAEVGIYDADNKEYSGGICKAGEMGKIEMELAEARDNDAYFCGVHAERARCIKAVVDEPEPDRPTPAVATITRAVKANILARINAQGGEVQSE